MSEITVTQLADEISTPIERLLEQLKNSGLQKKAQDTVSEEEKEKLLAYLNIKHGGKGIVQPKKMTLKRTKKSTLSIKGAGGVKKSVVVEVRKKRTYIKKSEVDKKAQEEINKAKEKEQALEQQKQEKILEAKKLEEKQLQAQEKKDNLKEKEQQVISNKEQTKPKSKQNSKIPSLLQVTKKTTNTTKDPKKEKEQISTPINKEKDNLLQDKLTQAEVEKTEIEAKKLAKQAQELAKESEKRWQEEQKEKAKNTGFSHLSSKFAQEAENETAKKAEGKRHNKKQLKKLNVKKATQSSPINSSLKQSFQKPVNKMQKEVSISETITIAELANRMSIKGGELIKKMMKLGEMVTINQIIDQDTAILLCEEMGIKYKLTRENEAEHQILTQAKTDGDQKTRAPVVTIMGHVDHGKTSLLDYIRKAKIADVEAGGITQHIGAYHVKTKSGNITFLDTPGHAAFTAMRSRGAKLTDIVVLVVAADDGVMPQTIEAIAHAKAAKVPLVVAVNKIDKEGADLEKIKAEVAKHDVLPDDWGGDTPFISVSAKTGSGIDDLLESILLVTELLDLKAVYEGIASGIVIESRLDKGRGVVASVLVQQGTLKKGDILLCGLEYGKVKAMKNDRGQDIKEATPSIPVEVLGLSGVPSAGHEATVVLNEKKAREVALYRQGKYKDLKIARQKKASLENMFKDKAGEELSEINIVLKADVGGSAEAIVDSLNKLSSEKVKVNVISSGVGAISESDVSLAVASSAIILGFNVRASVSAKKIVEQEKVDLRYYSVIYVLLEEVEQAMLGALKPEYKQKIIGLAEVREVFKSPKLGAIAGSMVIEGVIKRSAPIRVLRDNIVIYEGELESLRRFKDDVSEVKLGTECGIGVKNYNDIKIKDQIEVFETVEVNKKL